MMSLFKFKNAVRPEAILFLGALLLYLPGALVPPTNIIYNVDELYIVYSTMGLFAGLTPTSLVWPAGTLLFLIFPLYAIDLGVFALSSVGLSFKVGDWLTSLSAYLASGFFDSTHPLILGRMLIATASAFVPALSFNLSKRLFGKTTALFFAGIIATSPLFTEYSHILKADAFAMPFWLLTLLFLLDMQGRDLIQEKQRLMVSAISLGIAVATRSTYAVFLPVLFGFSFLILRGGKMPIGDVFRTLSRMMFGFAVVFLLFTPFVWTTPLTFLKTAIGAPIVALTVWRNYSVGSIGILVGSAFPGLVGWGGIILAVLGLVFVWRERRYLLASLLLITFFLFGIPLASSGFVYERYALPLLPILGLSAAMGFHTLFRFLPTERTRWIAGLLALIVLMSNLVVVLQRLQMNYRLTAQRETASWLLASISTNAIIAIPSEFEELIRPNSESLQRLLFRYTSQNQMTVERSNQLFEKVGVSSDLSNYPTVLTSTIFGQIEQQDRFRYELMAWANKTRGAPPNVRNVIYYARQPDKLDLVDTSLVWQLFDKGEIQVVVTTLKDYSGKLPARCFSVNTGSGYCVFTTSDELILR